jgi:UDP-N-acetylmuramyl pentapeptide phosphotransferase/UDP-N-acetylglucosamine-1-phosphate transferase
MLFNLVNEMQHWLEERGLYHLVMVLNQLEFRAFFAVVVSFVIVLAFGNRTIRWLLKQKIGDAPELYNEHVNKLMAG